MQREVLNEPILKEIMMELQDDPTAIARPGLSLKQGLLFKQGRLVISSQSRCIPLLLKEFHSSLNGGHSRFLRMYRRIMSNLYWISMTKCVKEFVKSCDICQGQKYVASSPMGLLQPLQIAERIWENISMDFIIGLLRSKGFEVVFVVGDRLSKYGHFIPLKHPYATQNIWEFILEEIISIAGDNPSNEFIISSRDKWEDRGSESVFRILSAMLCIRTVQ